MKPTGKTHKKTKKIKQPSEPRGCIYLLTNLVNGKRYVGQDQTGDPENHRWKAHIKAAFIYNSQYPLHRAMRKADRKSKGKTVGLSAEIIWRGPVSQLNCKETYYIKKLHSYVRDPLGDKSYNQTIGGDGARGHKHSKKTLKQMSTVRLEWLAIPENKAAYLASVQTLEACIKRSVALKKYFASMTDAERIAYSKKMSRVEKKRYAKPGALEVMCAAQIKRFADEELKAANAAAHRTPEFIALQSKITKKKWKNKKWRKQQIATRNTDEAHVKASAIGKMWHSDKKVHAKWLEAVTAPAVLEKISDSLTAWHAKPANKKKHQATHQTAEFRAKKAKNTTEFWARMTSEERSIYWHKIRNK